MATLFFIGLGLGDERDLSERARTVLESCSSLFAEEYTSTLASGSLERLEKLVGHPIHRLGRSEVESERPVLEALAASSSVAFLAVGDPFAATTHVHLRLAAEKAGHAWAYLPNASILTAAAGYLGLMHYRFGPTVSLPLPAPGFAPTSPLDRIAENLGRDLHTLVLLDLQPTEGKFLTAPEALRMVQERAPDRQEPLFPDSRKVAVVARVGTPSAQGWYGTMDALRRQEFGPPLHSLVIPAQRLHFEEEAAIHRYAVG